MSDTFSLQVKAELIRNLYRQGPITIAGNWVVGCVLVYLLWDSSPHRSLLMWFIALSIILLIRLSQVTLFFKYMPVDDALPRWGAATAVGTWVVGSAWAAAAILFLNVEEPTNVIGITVIMIGLSAGSIVTLASYLPSFYGIVIPTLGSLIAVLLWRGGAYGSGIAVLAGVALIAFTVSGRSMHRLLRESLALSYENLELRKEAEEKTALLEATLQNMSQGISLVDGKGRLKLWNQRLFELLGIDGTGSEEGADPETLFRAARPPLELDESPRSEYSHESGRVLEIAQNTMPGGGKVITCTDITDMKRREAALEVARSAAEQANSAKTRFLAAASHDLRQPIHALGLLFASLSNRVQAPETDVVLQQIDEAIEAIDSMLNTLLDISKLDAGIVQPTIGPVSAGALLRRLSAEYHVIARERGISLRVRPTDVTVRSDPSMLERILNNLISNALQHTRNSRVLVGARRRGDTVRFEVYDTGPGIPEHQLDAIFVEFQQLGNPERDRRQGLGLGLAIVKRVAAILDHPIEVRSTYGRGSRFSVTVPLSFDEADTLGQSDKPAPLPDSDLRERVVLVLDDDTSVLRAMDALLEQWGCTVITASSVHEARNQVSNGKPMPDLLIIDFRLPHHQSGLDAVRELHEITDNHIPVLFITGDTAPERLREVRHSGYPLLHKPVAPEKLRAEIRRLITRTN